MRRPRLALAVALLTLGAPAALYTGCSDSEEQPLVTAGVDASSADRVIAVPEAGGDVAVDAPAEPPCADAGGAAPQELRCTGLYASFAQKTLAPGVRPYAPAVPFWSDGAEKERWLYLPPGTTIDTSNLDEWVFPVGTKVWKQFSIGGVRIETRLFWKVDPTRWVRTTYRWSADGQTSATRLDLGQKDVVGSYEIPQAIDCDTCHVGKKDRLLGVELVNLGLPGATGVTLADLADGGLLTAPPPATTITLPNDVTGVAPAALGWLHANCGSCHARSTDATAFFTGFYARLTAAQLFPDGGAASVTSLDPYATTANVAATQPQYTPLGFPRIAPGDADHSLLAYLAGRRDTPDAGADAGSGQIPPLLTHVVDDAGVGKLRAWINGMPEGGL
jgi:hypothetical protein